MKKAPAQAALVLASLLGVVGCELDYCEDEGRNSPFPEEIKKLCEDSRNRTFSCFYSQIEIEDGGIDCSDPDYAERIDEIFESEEELKEELGKYAMGSSGVNCSDDKCINDDNGSINVEGGGQ
jgi:hypothetical protein